MRRNATILVWIALAALTVFAPTSSGAQTVLGQSLAGDWFREDSNYDPWDQMRISIKGDGTLTVVPSAATRAFRVGQVLWTGITASGALQVRASDGRFYPAQLTIVSADEIELDISPNARGNKQTWRRAGPDISGDWVRVALPGAPLDGVRLRGTVAEASVRFLPAAAPRYLRVSSRVWQNVTFAGAVDVLGSDRQYHAGTLVFISPDQIEINAPQVAGGPGQVWVRPTLVASTRAGLNGPVTNPNTPGSGLQPPTTTPVYTPPATPPQGPRACSATSLPDDRMRLGWDMTMSSTNVDRLVQESAGVFPFMGPAPAGSGFGNLPPDLERFDVPGIGTTDLWITAPGQNARWERTSGQSALLFRQEIQSRRNAADMRPKDVEMLRDTLSRGNPATFSAVWESNREGLDWHLEYDLSSQEYGTAFRNYRAAGFRLVDMEVYGPPVNPRYAAVWWASCDNSNWKQIRGMTAATLDARVAAESQIGFQVIDVEAYRTSSGRRYAAIWHQMPAGREWEVETADNFAEFLSLQRDFVDQGFRPIDLESVTTPNGPRYVGVWAENEDRYDFAVRPLIDTAIMNYRNLHVLPGVSVVVMRDDEVIYRRGLGWADSASAKRAHAGTIYLSASISKAMAGNIAAQLEARDPNFTLTQPTSDFLPNLPAGHTHTLEQLLAKTGCVRHYRQVTNAGRPDTLTRFVWQKDAVEDLWGDTLLSSPNCTPGTDWHYSTHGYTYLGAALEEHTGMSSIDLVETELAQPYGLKTLEPDGRLVLHSSGLAGVVPYEKAQGYERTWINVGGTNTPAGPRREVDYANTTWKLLGGGLRISTLDLARFGWLTSVGDTTRLWTPLTTNSRWNPPPAPPTPPPPPTTALGWVVDSRNPVNSSGNRRAAAEHGGVADRGGRTLVRIYRDVSNGTAPPVATTSLTIAIMTNQTF